MGAIYATKPTETVKTNDETGQNDNTDSSQDLETQFQHLMTKVQGREDKNEYRPALQLLEGNRKVFLSNPTWLNKIDKKKSELERKREEYNKSKKTKDNFIAEAERLVKDRKLTEAINYLKKNKNQLDAATRPKADEKIKDWTEKRKKIVIDRVNTVLTDKNWTKNRPLF